MAKKSFKKGKRPTHSLSFSVRVGKGKYKKGPSAGAWSKEDGPKNLIAGGSLSGEYLSKAISFLRTAEKKDLTVGFSIWENDGKFGKKRDDDEDDDDEDGDEDEDEDEDDDDDWGMDDDDDD